MDVASSWGGFVSFLIGCVGCCWGAWTHHASIVTEHVERISQLSSYGCEPQYGIHALGIAGYSRGAEVLDELAHAHQLARRAECLLGRFIRGYGRRGSVRAVQVPGEEAGEVLESAEDFVPSDWKGGLVRDVHVRMYDTGEGETGVSEVKWDDAG